MAIYTVTADSDAQIMGITSLTKEIDGVEHSLSVNKNYATASWNGELSTSEVDAITEANDAWEVGAHAVEGSRDADDINDDLTADDFPTGFIPASYSSLEQTTGDLNWESVQGTVDWETLEANRAVYESLGVGGLESGGWVATEEEFVVQGTVTLEAE